MTDAEIPQEILDLQARAMDMVCRHIQDELRLPDPPPIHENGHYRSTGYWNGRVNLVVYMQARKEHVHVSVHWNGKNRSGHGLRSEADLAYLIKRVFE